MNVLPETERFERHITKQDGCWLWSGCKNKKGYGMFLIGDSARLAHRESLRIYGKPIPQGMTVDHLCRNRACVNPDHLESVPHSINVSRGTTGIVNRSKTRCPRGHEYSSVNSKGSRYCKICCRDNTRKYRAIAKGAE